MIISSGKVGAPLAEQEEEEAVQPVWQIRAQADPQPEAAPRARTA